MEEIGTLMQAMLRTVFPYLSLLSVSRFSTMELGG